MKDFYLCVCVVEPKFSTPTQKTKMFNPTQLNSHFKLTQYNPYNMDWVVRVVELFGLFLQP